MGRSAQSTYCTCNSNRCVCLLVCVCITHAVDVLFAYPPAYTALFVFVKLVMPPSYATHDSTVWTNPSLCRTACTYSCTRLLHNAQMGQQIAGQSVVTKEKLIIHIS